MIVALTRSRWIPLAVIGAAAAVHAGMWASVIPRPAMPMITCLATAAAVTATASLAAVAARAVQLGHRAARALACRPRAPLPAPGQEAAARAGARKLTCLRDDEVAAFCAGLWRSRIYLTDTAALTLQTAELDAVLAHEAAHARRRDPLRRLLTRAAADVLFYLPLTTWLSGQQAERAELAADRAAIATAGRKAVAAALLATSTPATAPAAAAPFDGAIDARIAQLSGEAIPVRRPPARPVLISLAGVVLVLSLAMCLGQAALRL